MVLRSVSLAAILFLSAGCATVSMQPASLTTSFTQQKSELTKQAEAYSATCVDAGWTQASNPLGFIHKSLFPGADQEEAATTFGQSINAETADLNEVQSVLIAQITEAHSSLAYLNQTAAQALDSSEGIVRADVRSYEEALISARKAYRSFEDVRQTVEDRSDAPSSQVDNALAFFDDEIERSKSVADLLVARWQNQDGAVS